MMLVVDSHGEGEALVDRLHDAEIAAELVPFECVAAAAQQATLVVVEALACGPSQALAVGGSRAVLETAKSLGKPAWLVAGVGTRMPESLWQGMVGSLNLPADWHAGLDVIDMNRFDRIIGPLGSSEDPTGALQPECPPSTELLRRSAI